MSQPQQPQSPKLEPAVTLGVAVCEALGIDASLTRSIEMKLVGESNGVLATVTVERYVTDEQKRKIAIVLAKYDLVPRSGEQTDGKPAADAAKKPS